MFNLISAALGIVFAPYLVQLVLTISSGAGVGQLDAPFCVAHLFSWSSLGPQILMWFSLFC